MLGKYFASLIFIVSATYFSANAQKVTKTLTLPAPTPAPLAPPPGSMILLADYIHIQKRGIDTAVGEISKTGGMVIRYDNGFLAGNYAGGVYRRNEGSISMYKQQTVNGLTLTFIHAKNGETAATFSETCANFITVTHSDEDLTDFLLMIMTYRQSFNPANIPTTGGRPGC